MGSQAPDVTPVIQKEKWYRNISGWPFMLAFSFGSLLFWILEVGFQYFILTGRELSISLVRGSAFAGATLIAAALFSSAIFKWYPKWAQYWRIRRYLGVSGFMFIVFHVLAVETYLYAWNIPLLFFSWNPIVNPALFGLFAFTILFCMAVTSTDWAMRKLGRRWKFIHRFVYAAFAASILHFMFMNPPALLNLAGYLLIAMTAAAAFGQLYWFFRTVAPKRFKSLGTLVGFSILIAFLVLAYLGWAYRLSLNG